MFGSSLSCMFCCRPQVQQLRALRSGSHHQPLQVQFRREHSLGEAAGIHRHVPPGRRVQHGALLLHWVFPEFASPGGRQNWKQQLLFSHSSSARGPWGPPFAPRPSVGRRGKLWKLEWDVSPLTVTGSFTPVTHHSPGVLIGMQNGVKDIVCV